MNNPLRYTDPSGWYTAAEINTAIDEMWSYDYGGFWTPGSSPTAYSAQEGYANYMEYNITNGWSGGSSEATTLTDYFVNESNAITALGLSNRVTNYNASMQSWILSSNGLYSNYQSFANNKTFQLVVDGNNKVVYYNSTGFVVPVVGAQGQGDGQISMDASHNRIGFVPLDVGLNYGAYQMANYRSNISVLGNQNQITVRATASNTPVADGQVVFRARASLVVNGNITQTQVLANGLAVFKLPDSQNISLTVNGGWTMYYDYGGAAVPVYHPIFWPFSLNFTDNFKLK
jgi:hypothetical protein